MEGGGIGLIARPAGAYVIKDGVVQWQPAFDLNRTVGLVAGPVAVWSVAERRRNSASSRRWRRPPTPAATRPCCAW